LQEAPKVFISYSHDSEEHKKWVLTLATELRKNGIDIILDQWDLDLGSNLPNFMEQGLNNSERIIIICSDEYIRKSNLNQGGVGYEKIILTANLMKNLNSNKIIPVIRNVNGDNQLPNFIWTPLFIDFSDDNKFKSNLDNLLRDIHNEYVIKKPKIGQNPFKKKTITIEKNASVFFQERISTSFPGIRGIQWFNNPKEIIERLKLVFKIPYATNNYQPIWWWRDGELSINSFLDIGNNKILINGYNELIIKKMAVFNIDVYHKSFIYIETEADEPSKVYNYQYCKDAIKEYGYCDEEFAIFKNHYISRVDYDDGATIIDNKVIQLNGEAEIRVRHLTPYNIILAPHNSSLTVPEFDMVRKQFMKDMLLGNDTIENFAEKVKQLPKNRFL